MTRLTTTTRATAGEPSRITVSGLATQSGTVECATRSATGRPGPRCQWNRCPKCEGHFPCCLRTWQPLPGVAGNGRAIPIQTDSGGYARANFTPLDDGIITVRANVTGVTATVTFTISTGSVAPTGMPDTTIPRAATSRAPVVHVGAASRPPMLWVEEGAIYALVGASEQRFAPGVDNALNIAVGGGKVYWTEMTGESSGTINSANLNGSDVTELASIMAVPMGIAVDVAGSKLYWTNSVVESRVRTSTVRVSRTSCKTCRVRWILP